MSALEKMDKTPLENMDKTPIAKKYAVGPRQQDLMNVALKAAANDEPEKANIVAQAKIISDGMLNVAQLLMKELGLSNDFVDMSVGNKAARADNKRIDVSQTAPEGAVQKLESQTISGNSLGLE
jgi:hypothetical protein